MTPAGGTGGAAAGGASSSGPSAPSPTGSGGTAVDGAASSAGGSGGSAGSNEGAGGNEDGSSGGGSDGPSFPVPSPDGGTTVPDPDPGEEPEPAPCADGELESPDGACLFLSAAAQSFFAARTACRARGTGWDLASVRSPEVGALLGDALTFEGWLVGTDVASEGNWAWLDDGAAFWQGGANGAAVAGAYANWNATEPNGGNTTNCLRALPRTAGSANPDAPWADIGCTELRGSICRGPQR